MSIENKLADTRESNIDQNNDLVIDPVKDLQNDKEFMGLMEQITSALADLADHDLAEEEAALGDNVVMLQPEQPKLLRPECHNHEIDPSTGLHKYHTGSSYTGPKVTDKVHRFGKWTYTFKYAVTRTVARHVLRDLFDTEYPSRRQKAAMDNATFTHGESQTVTPMFAPIER